MRGAVGGDLANRVVAPIGDIDVALAVDGDTARRGELAGAVASAGAVHAAAGAVAGQRRRGAVGRDLADVVAVKVGDIRRPRSVDGDAVYHTESRLRALTVLIARLAIAGQRGRRAVERH